jgi:Protein of unknown function (DUF2474)
MRARSQPPRPRWIERLAWLCLFWVAGVSAMGLVVWLLRGLMRAAGLTS